LSKINEILLKYWGYSGFRPLQEDIINSVLAGNDTLALLPTGGGKSICYQVPTLAKEGICIVISPLISLIKDQVETLRSNGIIAVSVHSGLHKREIDIALDYCVYGKPKFLFVSPERLETELFRVRVQKMKVNLIAIDEAHCISQWGYDFRPSYLKIAEVRKLLPNVPVLALTATATPEVVEDIKEKLAFKNSETFFQTFERNNLIYVCRKTDNKIQELKNICTKLKGTGIVYVRNRRRTVELAQELNKINISAGPYHAGLPTAEREKAQSDWKKNNTRIIVATNAFGMGIDKPDVRFVIHFDLPDSPEAYYQEAGRGGRDGKISYAVIVYNENDTEELNYFHTVGFPDKELIRSIYISIGNYFKLAVGSGQGESFVFDMEKFCAIYKYKPVDVLSSLKIMELDGILDLSDAVFSPSRIKFEVTNFELYNFQIKNPSYDKLTKLLLRKYPGLFEEFIKIKEADLATLLKSSINEIKQLLKELSVAGIIKYIEQTDMPFITFLVPRILERDFKISKLAYDTRKINAEKRINAIKNYIHTHDTCRNTILLAYFNEKTKQRCGKCDTCVAQNKLELSNIEFERLVKYVLEKVKLKEYSLQELNANADLLDKDKLVKIINWLVEAEKISLDGNLIRLKS
jgi:ATP-dependent DNA helicase RecQ